MGGNSEYYAGLMSGTSLDGIDAVLVDFSAGRGRLLHTVYHPYSPELRQRLLLLHEPQAEELHLAALAGNELAHRYAAAVAQLLQEADIAPQRVAAIGCHGQTIRHRPEHSYTIQLGNPALLAELSGVAIVADFRSRDIAAGGQGAPLVPAFHAAMLHHGERHRVIVNVGGIANLTNLPPEGEVTGFDCGPGNLLLDAWIGSRRGETYDRDGAWAAGGTVIPGLLQALLEHPFFHQAPPKSAGRETFNPDWVARHLKGSESDRDVQATLLQLTVEGIVGAIGRRCPLAREVYLCGGGARNKALVAHLRHALAGTHVALTDELGVDADWLEAFAFAWLARQTVNGKTGNLPAVTGARHPCVLGAIHPA